MILALASTVALAGPTFSVGPLAEGGSRTGGEVSLGGGALGTVGFGPERWQLEVALSGVTGTTTRLRPQLRLWLADPDTAAFSVAVGAGGAFDVAAYGHGALELALDPGRGTGLRPRVAALALPRVWPEPGFGAGVTLGVAWHPPRASEPVVEAPRPVLEGALVWVPAPVCAWLPPDEATAALERVDLTLEEPQAVGRRSVKADADRADVAGEGEAATTGDLVVVARSGDQVRLDGEPVDVSAGHVVLTRPEGDVELAVVGAGRQSTARIYVARGATSWVRVPDPAEITLTFAGGSARLDAAATRALDALAAQAGRWRFEVAGGFSPEGNRAANLDLAQRRAEAVRSYLIEHGLPEAALSMGEAFEPSPDLPYEAQRVARVLPVVEGS